MRLRNCTFCGAARNFRSQSGSAIVEASIAIPLLVLFLYGVIDLGMWLGRYSTTSRLAYEGARYAAKEPGLIVPTPVTCDLPTATDARILTDEESSVCQRIGWLFVGIGEANNPSAITISRSTEVDAAGNSQENVSVQASLPYQPIFAIPGLHSVTVTVQAPYLTKG